MATCKDCFHWNACQTAIKMCNCKVIEIADGAQECENYLPTADVAPVKHGRWIEIIGMAPPEYHNLHCCSICGDLAMQRNHRELLTNYCPNCGAKMDLEDCNTYD